MAFHLLPLLFAKAVAKIGAKKAFAHHGARHGLAGKVARDGTEQAIDTLIDKGKDKIQGSKDKGS